MADMTLTTSELAHLGLPPDPAELLRPFDLLHHSPCSRREPVSLPVEALPPQGDIRAVDGDPHRPAGTDRDEQPAADTRGLRDVDGSTLLDQIGSLLVIAIAGYVVYRIAVRVDALVVDEAEDVRRERHD
jgi:hypothetical protein